jgi:predicted secreted hydrolase
MLLAATLLLSACGPAGQSVNDRDFAFLAMAEQGYAEARPGRPLAFPRDHGPHPDFRIEWWYLTANLSDNAGRAYGAQWTLFRTAVRPPGSEAPANPWQSEQVYMAHFALTGPDGHRAFQRYARGGVHDGEARGGSVAEPFAAWLDDWKLQSSGPGWLPLEVQAGQEDHALRLVLDSDRPIVLQGDRGFSQKHPDGGGSYYYSQPFLDAEGELVIDGRVIAVRGNAWLDREWSSQFLQPGQSGWDWFALHLESGEKLMLFRLRGAGEAAGSYRHGVLIAPDGTKRDLDPERIGFREVGHERIAGRMLPLTWQIELPEIDRSIRITTEHSEQWMDVDFPYWEGTVTATGDTAGSRGVGYLEMTGYPVER